MKRFATALLVLTAACATPPEPEVPVYGAAPGRRCDAARAQPLVGQVASAALGTRALSLSGARAIRWIQPGQAVTMDYREDRLNIELDGANRVRAIRCG